MRNLRVPDPHATWTEDDGRAALEAWRASGDSLAAFARRERLGVQRLYWWKRRLGWDAPRQALAPLSSVPAMVIGTPAASPGITIRLPNGLTIEVADASPGWVDAASTTRNGGTHTIATRAPLTSNASSLNKELRRNVGVHEIGSSPGRRMRHRPGSFQASSAARGKSPVPRTV